MGIVVVLGSLITDLVARAPRMPHAGESLIGDDFNIFLGGKGINQAIAASRLGAEVTLIGRVGSDAFGDGFFTALTQEGIDSSYVERDANTGTGASVIVIASDSGQNAIVANPRANMAVPAETVVDALHATRQKQQSSQTPSVFLTQCETSRISFMTGLEQARSMGMMTILNAAPIPREPLEDKIFTLTDILIVNEVEAAALSNIAVTSVEAARSAAESLLARGPQHVIVTLGAQGSLWAERANGDGGAHYQMSPAFPVHAVDATAAGDSFCGALAASLAAGVTLPNALRRASAAGAIAASRHGAIAALPFAADIEALLS
ncbi:MAG TPA: ribokinase [Ktedonobacteraceae bacterium]|jgi:ribokinase|nr:ribokinase [Ktedonobacteraceae bacterium]